MAEKRWIAGVAITLVAMTSACAGKPHGTSWRPSWWPASEPTSGIGGPEMYMAPAEDVGLLGNSPYSQPNEIQSATDRKKPVPAKKNVDAPSVADSKSGHQMPFADFVRFKDKHKADSESNDDLLVALAQVHQGAGRADTARKYFEKALQENGEHTATLLAYAHLLDAEGELAEATSLYERAVKKSPNDAKPRNDLGICLARRRLYDASIRELKKAVELDPGNARYRNNLATVLVEIGRLDEAYRELAAAHPPAIAHYNLAFLLNRQGDRDAALTAFQKSLQADPTMEQAKTWIKRLGGTVQPRPEAATASWNQGTLPNVDRQSVPAVPPSRTFMPSPQRASDPPGIGPAPEPPATPSYLRGNTTLQLRPSPQTAPPASNASDALKFPSGGFVPRYPTGNAEPPLPSDSESLRLSPANPPLSLPPVQ